MTDTRAVDAASQRGIPAPPTRGVRLRRAGHYVRRTLVWSRIYRATSYARSALWIVPFVAIVLVLIVAPTLRWLDGRLGWRLSGLDLEGAHALY